MPSGIQQLLLCLCLCMLMLPTDASLCYSCAGTCHNEHQCNCQMGSCEADACFIEKKPTEVAGIFRITKGCVKRPSRRRDGCDYDNFPNQVQCVCKGDFCNDSIVFRWAVPRRNITCRNCPERQPDCGRTCQGQWCHEKLGTGGSGCGHGPPGLPYFYRGPELLQHRSKICISMSRGGGVPSRYCICNTPMCNYFYRLSPQQYFASAGTVASSSHHKLRSVSSHYRDSPTHPLTKTYECVSCDVTAEDSAMTSSCRQNKCTGHYCVYATQRLFMGGGANTNGARPSSSGASNSASAIIHEKQGCLNVTDDEHIQLGCSHKWMNNEEEELYCACTGNNCNLDLSTASTSGGDGRASIGWAIFVTEVVLLMWSGIQQMMLP